jgi:hypothetical protein
MMTDDPCELDAALGGSRREKDRRESTAGEQD